MRPSLLQRIFAVRLGAPIAAVLGLTLVAAQSDTAARTVGAFPDAATNIVLLDCVTSASSRDRVRSLGVVMYPWFGSGVDPQSVTSGSIDVGKVVAAIEQRLGPEPEGWAMLDFEEPFDSWMALPADDPKNVRGRQELLRVIRAVKLAFPRVKWSYYALPRLRRYIPGPNGENQGWHFLSEEAREREIARCHATYGELMAAQDWFCPSFYDVYENEKFVGDSRRFMLLNESAWQRASCQFVKSVRPGAAGVRPPLLPCISPFFQVGGLATEMKAIAQGEFVADQLEVALAEGADGFCIWSGIDFVLKEATIGSASDEIAVQVRTVARSAWKDQYLGGKEPIVWTSDDTRFRLSQAIGDAIANSAEIACRAIARRARSADQPVTAPSGSGTTSP